MNKKQKRLSKYYYDSLGGYPDGHVHNCFWIEKIKEFYFWLSLILDIDFQIINRYHTVADLEFFYSGCYFSTNGAIIM